MPIDWHEFHRTRRATPAVVDSRRRLGVCLGGFVFLLVVVFSRAVQLEMTQGAAFRAEATKPLRRERSLPGVRGRILARDGTMLAYDRKVLALAVHYRYLEDPPDRRWLRRSARSRLNNAQRKDPRRVAAEEDRVRAERVELARRLAALCGMTDEQWNRRAGRIQARVERVAETVNRRRSESASPRRPADSRPRNLLAHAGRLLRNALRQSMDERPPAWITVAEELDYHVMAEDVPLAVVAEIEDHPKRYAGVKILSRSCRAYPFGQLAAHVLGHLGPVTSEELEPDPGARPGYHPQDLVGRLGLERQYEWLLRGRRGTAVELTDHSGQLISSHRRREPGVGRDLVLTLDRPLQQAAETLLDEAIRRRRVRFPDAPPAGAGLVVIDVRTGAVRAAASAPRFDPNLFVEGTAEQRAAVLADEAHPLFDRVSRMAIPPGSVFKTLSAVALLADSPADAREPLFCRGYLHRPDRHRCAIYRRRGIGHGEVTLRDALAVSCNVYFFDRCGRLGPRPLIDWARQFGFGEPTGVDLPHEARGTLPTENTIRDLEGHAWRSGDTLALAIGQGSLTATPLQVARMMAAVANGGRLVTPHLVSRLGLPELADGQSATDGPNDPIRVPPPRPIPRLSPAILATVREALERVVADPRGTAHATLCLDEVAIAGKTGTAETGPGRAAHAWFAGYAPAERPRLAFVVALEHAGDASTAAGPVAKRLVLRMRQLGMLD